MNAFSNLTTTLLFIVMVAFGPGIELVESSDKDPKPSVNVLDFTNGAQLPTDASHDWTLGPIGARGWFQAGGRGSAGDTSKSRQILITKVEPNGPSSKQLANGDVIVGVDQTLFQSDVRIAFAGSIESAESSDGKLKLEVFRDGKVKTVTIVLSTLPTIMQSKRMNWFPLKTLRNLLHKWRLSRILTSRMARNSILNLPGVKLKRDLLSMSYYQSVNK